MASGTSTASKAVILVNNTATVNVTRAAATSATTGGTGAVPPASTVVKLLQSLSPNFLTHLVNVAKDTLSNSTVGAEDEMNRLDDGALDTPSLQAQLQPMNKNGASANLVAPLNKVEVTGVIQHPYQQSFMYNMAAACTYFDSIHPKGSYGVIMQWLAAQVNNGVSLRNIPTHFGDQLYPSSISQPESNGGSLLGLQQHPGAFDDGMQSPCRLPRGGLLHPRSASSKGQANFLNQGQSPGSGLL